LPDHREQLLTVPDDQAMKLAPNWPIELTSGVRPNGTLMESKWTKNAAQPTSPARPRTPGRKSVQWPDESELEEKIVSPRQTSRSTTRSLLFFA
jgi:hypothetical protein